jgi:hypothetical protein
MDGEYLPDNGLSNNYLLRIGEVQKIFYPEDKENVSKRFVEYQVWVQHRANNTAVTKMYEHCIAIDQLSGVADYSYATYRADNTSTRKDGQRQLGPGLGARVILLCINGESQNAVILGGIRNAKSKLKDKKIDGHHQHTVFNGIDLLINKDGELTLTYGGATKLDGTLLDSVDQEAVGTFVKIEKNGNLTISDAKGENKIFVDRVHGKVQVTATEEIDHVAKKVRLGDGETDDPVVGGNELKKILEDLIKAINQLTVPTSNGPSGTPINASAFSAVAARLGSMLSGTVFTKV